jgi:hypothetical protein
MKSGYKEVFSTIHVEEQSEVKSRVLGRQSAGIWAWVQEFNWVESSELSAALLMARKELGCEKILHVWFEVTARKLLPGYD